MTTPLIERGEELLDGLVLGPEISKEDSGVFKRAFTLLSNQFVRRWVGIKIIEGIFRFLHGPPSLHSEDSNLASFHEYLVKVLRSASANRQLGMACTASGQAMHDATMHDATIHDATP